MVKADNVINAVVKVVAQIADQEGHHHYSVTPILNKLSIVISEKEFEDLLLKELKEFYW